MDEYYRVAKALPEPLAEELAQLSPCYAPSIQEIRLRVGQPVQFTIQGRLTPCSKYLPNALHTVCITAQCMQTCFLHLCRHSVYAHEEELRQGFFTLSGGSRIGVAGNWSQGTFSSVTSLNLRIARWITCKLPQPVQDYLSAGAGGLLVAGVPGSGKTTFLRTLVQFLSQKDHIVCVVDERGELMAGERNGLPDHAQLSCDVYTRCNKAEGIHMALRCMNPQYIVCDELGTTADIAAVEQGIASGARFLASVHCESLAAMRKKPQLHRLLQTGAFPQAVFLGSRETPGTITQWEHIA